ncbi:MAG: hypothetical protein KKC20_24735, partial [Proteobacteria bacterium]|nr:hypothetical protein [Pseudomonadota bacterium]
IVALSIADSISDIPKIKGEISNIQTVQLPTIKTDIINLESSIPNLDDVKKTQEYIDKKLSAISDSVTALAGQELTLSTSIANISGRLSTLEEYQKKQETQTPSPFPGSWGVTTNYGFNTFVEFINGSREITLRMDKKVVRESTDDQQDFNYPVGYFYTPINDQTEISFSTIIRTMPHLDDVWASKYTQDITADNYRIIVGVTDEQRVKVLSAPGNFVQAEIYPRIVNKGGSSGWECCSVMPRVDYQGGQITGKGFYNFAEGQLLLWKLTLSGDTATISVNGVVLPETIILDRYTKPVLYIGFLQSPLCESSGSPCLLELETYIQ